MSNEFSEWQKEYKSSRKKVEGVCFDGELLVEWEEAATEVANLKEQAAGMLEESVLDAAEERLAEVEERVRAAGKTLVFTNIGTKRWRDLLSEHPPEGDQRHVVTTLGLPLEFNPETFIPAAIAECCIEPGLTFEQAQWFVEVEPIGEVDRVFAAVSTLNVTGLRRPFGDTGQALLGAMRSTLPSS